MRSLFLSIFFISFFSSFSQDSLVISFYNVENLFDTLDTPNKNDREYLPTAKKHWNTKKYHQKLSNISRTLLAVNHWQGADIIGLCEVENKSVLEDLISKTNLKKYDYQIIHYEAPDKRGIDVAMLYKSNHFSPILAEGIEVDLPNKVPTRLILYVQGKITKGDTLHFFFNHWSSKRGGAIVSQPNRMAFSNKLKERVNFIYQKNVNAKIIIAGDFNDEIYNKSLQNLIKENKLYSTLSFKEKTLKYQNQWNQFDVFFVSTIFKRLNIKSNVFKTKWLEQKDQQFLGNKPFRTFQGEKYLGGYSDHFPIKMVFSF